MKEKVGIVITYLCFGFLMLCIFTASTVYGTINEGLGEKVTNFNVDGSDMTLLVNTVLGMMKVIFGMVLYTFSTLFFSVLSFLSSLLLRVIFKYKNPDVYRPKNLTTIFWGVSGVVVLFSLFWVRHTGFVNYIGHLFMMFPIPFFYCLNIAKRLQRP